MASQGPGPAHAQTDAPMNYAQPASISSSVSEVNKMDKFIQRGEEILDTFMSSIRAFEGQTLTIRHLESSMKTIQSDLNKFKDGEQHKAGLKRSADELDASSVIDDSSSDSDIDEVMRAPEKKTKHDSEHDFIDDMDSFFHEENSVGEDIKTKVAEMANKNLRRTTVDKDKFQKLTEQYKRPGNVEALQVPKVDKFLWNQLKGHVKSQDVAKQQVIDQLNRVAVPILQAMDYCCGEEKPDVEVIKKFIGDSFKMICGSVNKINLDRRESIKKELDPRFKSLCSSETPISASGLFGDNLQEASKQLDATKQIKMTAQRDPFLGQGRGGRYQPSHTQTRPYQPSHTQTRPGSSKQPYQQRNKSAISGKKWPKKNTFPRK